MVSKVSEARERMNSDRIAREKYGILMVRIQDRELTALGPLAYEDGLNRTRPTALLPF